MLSRKSFLPVLILGLVSAPKAWAECRYFLSHSHPEHCKAFTPDVKAPSDALLQDGPDGPAVELVCECDYTLKGAGPLAPQCDLDRSDEPSFITPAKDAKNPCRDQRRL